MAIDGTISSHGTCPNEATFNGLEHNKTNVAATISYIQQAWDQMECSMVQTS